MRPKEIYQEGTTSIQVYQFSYKWTIENFSFYCRVCETSTSPTFTTSTSIKSKWCLVITKSNYTDVKKQQLRLKLIASDEKKIVAVIKSSILNNKGEKTNLVDKGRLEFEQGKEHHIIYINDNVFIQENGLLPEDKLTIICEVAIIGDIVNTLSNMQFKVPECRLSDDMNMLFESERFSDVTLSVAAGKEYRVHKAILSARSTVFAAMFEHDMKEYNNNRVEITDVDYEVLGEILRFIYTGKTKKLDVMASDILPAADKYALERLKVLCEEKLQNNLSIENAMEILTLADRHSGDRLKVQAIDFVTTNAKVVMDTVEWKTTIKTNPHLIADICGAFANQQI